MAAGHRRASGTGLPDRPGSAARAALPAPGCYFAVFLGVWKMCTAIWCTASEAMDSGDYGTPGDDNSECPSE